jgi:hypothetical protein
MPEPSKPTRRIWRGAEIAELCKHFDHKTKTLHGANLTRFSQEEVVDKLIDLGLVEKPAKATLSQDSRDSVDAFIDVAIVKTLAEPERTLAARYAIKQLSALLPKRTPKAVAE